MAQNTQFEFETPLNPQLVHTPSHVYLEAKPQELVVSYVMPTRYHMDNSYQEYFKGAAASDQYYGPTWWGYNPPSYLGEAFFKGFGNESESEQQQQFAQVAEKKSYQRKVTSFPDPLPPIAPIPPDFNCGLLWVKAVRGEKLPNMDIGGKSDPYLVFTIVGDKKNGATKQRTKTIQDSLNPTWNQTFSFRIASLSETLHVDCYDEDVMKDDFMGLCDIDLGKFTHFNQVYSDCLELKKSKTGVIYLEFLVTKPSQYEIPPQNISEEGVLLVRLIEGKDLVSKNWTPGQGSDPYVEIEIDGIKGKKKTKPVEVCTNPYWKEEQTFQIKGEARKATMKLTIKDEGILMNQKMGNTKISLSDVYDNAIVENWDTLQGVSHGSIHYAVYFQPKVTLPLPTVFLEWRQYAEVKFTELLNRYKNIHRGKWDELIAFESSAIDWKTNSSNKKYTKKKLSVPVSRQVHAPVSLSVHAYGQITPHSTYMMAKSIVAHNVNASGRDGSDGKPGQSGHSGSHGSSGGFGGARGGNGGNGTSGSAGTDGTPGQNATPVSVSVAHNGANQLSLRGTHPGQFDVTASPEFDQIIVLQAKGGDGGHGGRGGDGGAGGGGGAGGHGRDGSPGHPNGGNGGPGGPGGNGGNGGAGGAGGDGKNGGHAGDITVGSSDPALLVYYEPQAPVGGEAGRAGAGGHGGHGGSAGMGGSGGNGGSAGTYTVSGPNGPETRYGSRGMSGTRGASGHSGASGPNGASGRSGVKGHNAGITFRVLDANGGVLQESPHRFNLQVKSYSVYDGQSAVQDGIFEPGQEIVVCQLVVINTGGLTLPPGSVVSLVSTKRLTSCNDSLVLPALNPNEEFQVPGFLRAFINQLPLPTKSHEEIRRSIALCPTAELLGQHLYGSAPVAMVDVMHPIYVETFVPFLAASHNETKEIVFTIRNRSLTNYCVSPQTQVALMMSVEDGLAIGCPQATPFGTSTNISQFKFPLNAIESGGSIQVKVAITMLQHNLFFDRKQWRATLLLRDRPIEFCSGDIRCSPIWEEQVLGGNTYKDEIGTGRDLILFAGHSFTLRHFLSWSKLASAFRLNLLVWDYDKYSGISYNCYTGAYFNPGEGTTWRRVAQSTVVLPPLLVYVGDRSKESQAIRYADFVEHFPYAQEKFSLFDSITSALRYDEGIIFCGMESRELIAGLGAEGKPVNLSAQNLYFGSDSSIGSPNKSDAVDKSKSICKSLHEKDQQHLYTIQGMDINLIKHEKGTSEKKWTYGHLAVTQVDLPTSARMICFPVKEQKHSLHDGTDEFFTCNEFTIGQSHYLDMVVTVYFTFSLRHKMLVMADAARNALPLQALVIKSQNECISLSDVFSVGLYADLKSDLITHDSSFPRVASLLAILHSNRELFANDISQLAIHYALRRIESSIGMFESSGSFSRYSKEIFGLLKEIDPEKDKKTEKAAKEMIELHSTSYFKSKKNKKDAKNFKSLLKVFLKSYWCHKFKSAK